MIKPIHYLLILLLLFSSQVSARQLLLIQGYLGQPSSWSDSGVAQLLHQNGWMYSGELVFGSQGGQLLVPRNMPSNVEAKDRFYRVSLPTEAPIANQGYYLAAYIKMVTERFPDQPLILVGHSAGGVVARYVMVRNPQFNVSMLITIASPHLGTDTAELGKLIGESPLALIAPLLGANTLNRSQSLYNDLLPELPHRFLYWLNRQPHPEAEYVSIVRDELSPDGGDLIVPAHSQYMDNVENLRHRARSYIVPGTHGLNPGDGQLILDVLQERVHSGVLL